MVNWCVTSKKFLFLCQSFSLAMLPFSSGSLDVKEDKIDALLGCKSQQQPTVASRPRNCILRVVRMLSKRAGKSPNKRSFLPWYNIVSSAFLSRLKLTMWIIRMLWDESLQVEEMMRIRAQVTLESPLYLKGFKVISSLKTCWASKFKIR